MASLIRPSLPGKSFKLHTRFVTHFWSNLETPQAQAGNDPDDITVTSSGLFSVKSSSRATVDDMKQFLNTLCDCKTTVKLVESPFKHFHVLRRRFMLLESVYILVFFSTQKKAQSVTTP